MVSWEVGDNWKDEQVNGNWVEEDVSHAKGVVTNKKNHFE